MTNNKKCSHVQLIDILIHLNTCVSVCLQRIFHFLLPHSLVRSHTVLNHFARLQRLIPAWQNIFVHCWGGGKRVSIRNEIPPFLVVECKLDFVCVITSIQPPLLWPTWRVEKTEIRTLNIARELWAHQLLVSSPGPSQWCLCHLTSVLFGVGIMDATELIQYSALIKNSLKFFHITKPISNRLIAVGLTETSQNQLCYRFLSLVLSSLSRSSSPPTVRHRLNSWCRSGRTPCLCSLGGADQRDWRRPPWRLWGTRRTSPRFLPRKLRQRRRFLLLLGRREWERQKTAKKKTSSLPVSLGACVLLLFSGSSRQQSVTEKWAHANSLLHYLAWQGQSSQSTHVLYWCESTGSCVKKKNPVKVLIVLRYSSESKIVQSLKCSQLESFINFARVKKFWYHNNVGWTDQRPHVSICISFNWGSPILVASYYY